ncbi:hypothetical protein ALC60_14578 [Trachymyrmex zeteki]|uniref:Uncharacterized protein n=1 Tax=Mycetomoellerius zeteki TaxID=64791 RepID=A0A151WF95_9HYME|nr:hypothetical protein ALC60_14578 [Trachymyrmex zeteki]
MDAEGEGQGEEAKKWAALLIVVVTTAAWLAGSVGQLASQPAVLAIALMRFTERRKDAEYLSLSFTAFVVTVPRSSPPARSTIGYLTRGFMTSYRTSIRETLDAGALRKGCMSTIRRVRHQGRGKTAPRNLSPSIFVSKWRHSQSHRRRHTNDDDLCKLQPVLNALRSPTLADSSKTFRNNSVPRARSCVPRPGSFLPFLR